VGFWLPSLRRGADPRRRGGVGGGGVLGSGECWTGLTPAGSRGCALGMEVLGGHCCSVGFGLFAGNLDGEKMVLFCWGRWRDAWHANGAGGRGVDRFGGFFRVHFVGCIILTVCV
jgi:hypothetical protein